MGELATQHLVQSPDWILEDHSDERMKRARIIFPNGWRGSVIQGHYSYGGDHGLYELAVMGKDGEIRGDTPVAPMDGVLGYLSEEEVMTKLREIAGLPQWTPEQKAVTSNGSEA